jgi:hypothetical protein
LEEVLLSRQPDPRGDDRERINRARQTAEALFAPKQHLAEPSVLDSLPPADQPARKPRVLAIVPTAPVRHEVVEAPVSPKPRTMPKIPRSEFARIRAWTKYGMTVPQVAELYGAAVDDIERIIRQA